jgi:hypothetical protein
MQQVKGSVLKARLAFVEQHGGAEGLARVKWVPFESGTRLDEAIVKEIGGGRRDFFERLGAASLGRPHGASYGTTRIAVSPSSSSAIVATPGGTVQRAPSTTTLKR